MTSPVAGTLVRRNHESPASARRELLSHGFMLAHSPPQSPEKWTRRRGEQFAIGREDRPTSSVWHIVEYPK